MDRTSHAHEWAVTIDEARAIQRRLASRVRCQADELPAAVECVAGVDVGFEAGNTITKAAVALLCLPELRLIEHRIARLPTRFPYVPGYLSFREIPAVQEAYDQLQTAPDLLLCDGHGVAHPRRLGIAAHLGVLLDKPSIGVAKKPLVGTFERVPEHKGDWVALMEGGERLGAVLRTRENVKPVYVSVGHRLTLETAVRYVMGCVTRYRLPETTRVADRLASKGA